MKRVVMMGPPGAGKGTQGALLALALGVNRYSTGEILREARAAGSKLGLEAKSFMDAGELVPDEVMLGIIDEALASPEASPGYVLDGFPRTVAQADGLNAMLERAGRPLDAVILLEVADDELVRRLSGRSLVDGRADDAPETVLRRLAVYAEETEPVVEWYRGTAVPVLSIDGSGSIETVQSSIQGQLGV
ncbi:MAG: adenylate kinase [Gemmatimonadota bacterium]